MRRQQWIFILLTILFISTVGYFVYDMAKRTTSPWERKKLKNMQNNPD